MSYEFVGQEDFSLDDYTSPQFVQNESLYPKNAETPPTREVVEYTPLEHTPIIPGTITGTIYFGYTAIQTFVWMEDGDIQLTKIGQPAQYVVGGHIDLNTGAVILQWSHKKAPRFSHIVTSYEYNMRIQNPKKARRLVEVEKESTFVKPTFETFFSTEDMEDIASNAGTVTMWDFTTCLGDTIKEKFESLYVKIHELANIVQRKGAKGYFWIATSPEIASIFEVATSGFIPATSKQIRDEAIDGHYPMGFDDVRYAGLIQSRYRLYKYSNIEKSMIVVGVNDRLEKPQHYGRMNVANIIF